MDFVWGQVAEDTFRALMRPAILHHLPEFMACIDNETVTVPYTAYPLSRTADAWAADDRTRAVIVSD